MADEEPTYYNVGHMEESGAWQADIIRAIYDLYLAVHALCNNLDEDSATLGTDYLSKIGTDLETAFANFKAPTNGPTT